MPKKIITNKKKQLLFVFFKLTQTVENSITPKLKFLVNKKNEIIKKLNDYIPLKIKTIWNEYQLTQLLKFSFIIILLLWIFLQAGYNHNNQYSLDYSEYKKIKTIVSEAVQIEAFLEDVIQGQQTKLAEMSEMVEYNNAFFLFGLGFATCTIILAYLIAK